MEFTFDMFAIFELFVEPVLGPRPIFRSIVGVGTSSNNTIGGHAGLPVAGMNTRNWA